MDFAKENFNQVQNTHEIHTDFIFVPKTKIIITVNMNTYKVIHKKYTYKTIVQDSM